MTTAETLGRGPALVVDGLGRRFGSRVAFEGVSFEIGYGEVFGFLGPNGAGKTSTVRTLGTLLAPSEGSAIVAGFPLVPDNGVEIRRRIAIMPESPGLYTRLSVIENLECFADLYETQDPADRIDHVLRAVNMLDRAHEVCGALSKGLRQRVALARALLSHPEILFLDEPTSGLDPVASREVHEVIDGLRQSGVTIFLTTHRLNEAERLSVTASRSSVRPCARSDRPSSCGTSYSPSRSRSGPGRPWPSPTAYSPVCRASTVGTVTASRATCSRYPTRSWPRLTLSALW